MDPNACLREMLEITADFDKLEDDEALIAANRLVDLVDGLDGWLSKGGFLPTRWERFLP
jgi:hypothetical protein